MTMGTSHIPREAMALLLFVGGGAGFTLLTAGLIGGHTKILALVYKA